MIYRGITKEDSMGLFSFLFEDLPEAIEDVIDDIFE